MEPAGQQKEALTVEVRRLIRTSWSYEKTGADICALGSEAIAILCSIVQAEGRRRSRLRGLFITLNLLGPASLILISVLPKEVRDPYLYLAWGTGFVGALGNLLFTLSERRATKVLASLNNIRVLGLLLEILVANYDDSSLKASIRYSLSRLLPHLQASDADSLLPSHISILNGEVNCCRAYKWGTPAEVAYALVVFKTLEQVGDETSIPVVEKVLASVPQKQVREAAEACLPFLQACAVMGKNTLLRAAGSDTTHLLLPAHGGERQGIDVLLRPMAAGVIQPLPEDEVLTHVSAG